jgi:hypothetical protein
MSDKDSVMKALFEGILEKGKNAKRDTKITVISGTILTISGHSLMDQEIVLSEVSVSWTDGSRFYFIPYSSIDHIVMV